MRRRIRRRAGLALLVLLASTPLQASASPAGPALLMSPSVVPEEPHPIPLRVEVEADPGATVEVKAWIGSPDRQASRTWNGTDWQRSDHYARTVTVGADGRWRGWVTVKANPSSNGYEALFDEADRTGLHVRTRGPDGATATATTRVRVLDPANTTWRTGAAPEAAYVAADPAGSADPGDPAGEPVSLAAVAPDPRLPEAPVEGAYRLPVPERGLDAVALAANGSQLGPVPDPRPPPLRLVEAVPRAYGPGEPAEAVALRNAGDEPVPLAGVCLRARGEACLRDGALAPGGRLTLARNATAYEAATGRPADPFPPPADGAPLALPDGGAVLRLARLGDRLDVLAYGNVTPPPAWDGPPLELPRPGEVLRRAPAAGGPTNASEPGAYGPRNASEPGAAGPTNATEPGAGGPTTSEAEAGGPLDATGPGAWGGGTRLGQTQLEPRTFRLEDRAWAAVAPEGSYDLLAGLLRRAGERILVEAYLLTSPSLARELAAALDRGVEVDLLVEGSPVGGRPAVEDRILEALARRGADVATLSSTPTFRARYPSVHAKAAVLDGETVVVGTENWARSGYPPGGEAGNRGWVVGVRDPGLARYMTWVLEADRAPRPDVHPVEASGARLPPRPVAPPPEPPSPIPLGNATATPVVAPDTARHPATVRGLLASARKRVDVQLLSLEPRFEAGPNPYVEALLDAAGRGVRVRVLLDATYVDEATGALENDAPRDALLEAARRHDLPVSVRLARGLDVDKVHTKGVVVDGEAVLVGSVNWVEASIARNREVGLVVRDPGVAQPFQEAFLRDWRASLPGAGVVPPAVPGPGLAAAAALAVAAGLARRAPWLERRREG